MNPLIYQQVVTRKIQTTEDQIDSRENQQTHRTEIKILRKKTINHVLKGTSLQIAKKEKMNPLRFWHLIECVNAK